MSKALSRLSSGDFTRELNKKSSLYCYPIYTITCGLCYDYASTVLLQTSFSLYLHNQWTDFHKLSCCGKPQMRAIRTYVGCTKATTND